MAKNDIYFYCANDPVYSPHWDWITENIALGSYPLSPAIQELREAGITAIISLRQEEPDYDAIEFAASRHINVTDCEPFPYGALAEGLLFLHRQIASGGKVYVHCFAGISRSSFFVSCYLMLSENIPFDEAVRRVQAARGICRPHPDLYDDVKLARLQRDRHWILDEPKGDG